MLSKTVLALCLLILLNGAACNEPEMSDGYQFGDITRIGARDFQKIVVLRNQYCVMDKNDPTAHIAREIALTAIRAYAPAYPPDGICSDLFDLLNHYVTPESP